MKTTNLPFSSLLTGQFVIITAILFTLSFLAQTASATSLDISAPTRKQGTPSTFVVPISASDLTNQGVIAFQFNILYDPAVITPVGDNFGCSTDGTLAGNAGMVAVCNVAPAGTLRVAVYGAYEMSGSGTVLNLRFATADHAQPGSFSALNFENLYFFNGSGYLETTGHNGGITLARVLSINTGRQVDIDISLPDMVQRPGSEFIVPLTVGIMPERTINAFRFNVVYDPAVIRPAGPNFGCSVAGTIGEAAGMHAYCSVIAEGELQVSVFSAYPMRSSGTLLNLTFTAAETGSAEHSSPLYLENVFFSGNSAIRIRNGQVRFDSAISSYRE